MRVNFHLAFKFLLWLSLVGVSLSLSANAYPIAANSSSEIVQIYTLDAAPMVTTNKDRPGYAYEIVKSIFELAGIPHRINILPWKRAQRLALTQKKSFIFPFSRTNTRDKEYLWPVKLYSVTTHFVTADQEKISEDAAYAKLIGVHSGSSWHDWLNEHDYPFVMPIPKEGPTMVSLLCTGRIDAWYTARPLAEYAMTANKCHNGLYSEPVHKFDVFLATHRLNNSPHMPALLAALDHIKQNGTYDRILEKYNVKESL